MKVINHELTVAVLADNQAPEPLLSEHGLAILIRADEKNILFDTGQGTALAANAEAMGIDLSIVDAIILSHGHYDHTGGLPFALSKNKTAEIFFHPGVFIERYSQKPDFAKPIHMPKAARLALHNHPANKLHAVSSPTEIFPGIFITGPIPRKTGYEDTGGRFYLDSKGKLPDLIEDDQSLWLETKKGLVIVVGCCHAGLENTIEYIRKISGQDRVHTIAGGFHLLNAGRLRMDRTIAYLQSLEFDMIYPCHCTGDAGLEELKQEFTDRARDCQAGLRINIIK